MVGRIATVEELMTEEGYDAVFIGSGAGLPMFMGIPGENLNGVYSANEFLTRVNLMRAYEFPQGGHAGVARTQGRGRGWRATWRWMPRAPRFGWARRRCSSRTAEPPRRCPRAPRRSTTPSRRASSSRCCARPPEIVGHDGWVTGMIASRMELTEPDESGRRAPVCVMDSEFEIECDTVIMAVGTRANPLLSQAAPDLELNRRGYIVTDEDGATNLPGVFAGGDIVTGAATVILAMGAGKKAARAMDRWLRSQLIRGRPHAPIGYYLSTTNGCRFPSVG